MAAALCAGADLEKEPKIDTRSRAFSYSHYHIHSLIKVKLRLCACLFEAHPKIFSRGHRAQRGLEALRTDNDI